MLEPSKSLRFESWRQLLDWLPRASESQLVTVFVWASAAEAPASERGPLEQVRRGAFEELVRRCQERLKSYLTRRHGVRDEHLVEDIVQDTLLQVYSRAELFDPERSFWGWILRIAQNKYIDHARRRRPGLLGRGTTESELDSEFEKLAVSSATPESDALARERRERFRQLVARLPATQRRIVQRKLEGARGIDIARELGKSTGFVSQAFHEAIEMIQEQLGD